MSVAQFDIPASLLVESLTDLKSGDLELAGGKGANLGELSRAGFDVPPGFVITTAAYDLLLQENGFGTRLAGWLAALDVENPDSVKHISQQIHDAIQQISIPGQIEDVILKSYRELGGGAVAVRSSATAEDLPEAAFAGQQETFLNVIGERELIEAVRACWASLWSERAILYRAHQNVDQASVKLAVVVQRMVPAEVAGVMFTANPVSGARDEVVIDANPGLGEAVVSGMVTPDHFVLSKRSQRITEKRTGRREVVIRPKAGGGTEEVTSIQNTESLSSQALRKLAQLGIAIEQHYGAPQDIEWAWVEDKSKVGRFLVLQARPMTALPEPLKVSGAMRMVVPILAEMWPTRPYPLDTTTFTGAAERAIGNLLVTLIGKSAPSPDEMLVEEDGVVVRFSPPTVHPSLSMLFMPWIALWRTRRYDPLRWEADPSLSEFIDEARAIEQRDLRSFNWKQNIETLQALLALIPRAIEMRERFFPQALPGLATLWLLLVLTRRTDSFGALTSGTKTKTTETNQALEMMAAQIRADPILREIFRHREAHEVRSALEASQAGRVFLKHFETFLIQYGHRETTLTISQPAWKDQPEIVLGILKVLAGTEPRPSNLHEVWQKTRDELLAHSILGTRFLRTMFLKSLAKARCLFQIREDTHFYLTLLQPPIRHVVLELGQRLRNAGALYKVEDVFHLRLEELQALGEPWPPTFGQITKIRALVARRNARRTSLMNKPMVDPRLLTIPSKHTDQDVLLNGSSGSPGIAKGPARIVHDVSEFGKLQAGDVLVAPATNPAWTPLFQRAAAVVVDTGGSASHAAIVAREYGVPAVMGTVNGTRELMDGQWIQVDGSRGLVLKAEESK